MENIYMGQKSFCSQFTKLGTQVALRFDNIGVHEQTLGWLPLDMGLEVEDEPSELSCPLKTQGNPTQCLPRHFQPMIQQKGRATGKCLTLRNMDGRLTGMAFQTTLLYKNVFSSLLFSYWGYRALSCVCVCVCVCVQQSKSLGESHPEPAQALPTYKRLQKAKPQKCLALRTRDGMGWNRKSSLGRPSFR